MEPRKTRIDRRPQQAFVTVSSPMTTVFRANSPRRNHGNDTGSEPLSDYPGVRRWSDRIPAVKVRCRRAVTGPQYEKDRYTRTGSDR